MTTRPRFGLDVDGVLYQFGPMARRLLRDRFGLDMASHSTHWGSIKNEAGDEAWRWLWSPEGGLRMLFSSGEPYPGAVEAVQEIAEYADIVIITSVPGAAIHDRTDWLARHRIPCAELHVTTQPKHFVTPHCAVYLDDGPHNIEALRSYTTATILIWDQPWNQNVPEDGTRVIRARNWQIVIDTIRQLATSAGGT